MKRLLMGWVVLLGLGPALALAQPVITAPLVRESVAQTSPPATAPANRPEAARAEPGLAETGTDADAGAGAGAAAAPADIDPWERRNRKIHRFNRGVDRYFARPVAKGYKAVTPKPLRSGIRNFFVNIFQPLTAVNLILQGRPGAAASTLGRFSLNIVLGLGGLADPATDAKMKLYREDFGQTFAVWGWRRSRYLEVPFLGPSTPRDLLGFVAEIPIQPYQWVETPERYGVIALNLLSIRAELLSSEELIKDSGDEYLLFRSAYLQSRDFQINDRSARDQLPDYLLDDPDADEGEE
ncbi:MAG: VacJ family lipoprotein [Lysobacterales bacterium]